MNEIRVRIDSEACQWEFRAGEGKGGRPYATENQGMKVLNQTCAMNLNITRPVGKLQHKYMHNLKYAPRYSNSLASESDDTAMAMVIDNSVWSMSHHLNSPTRSVHLDEGRRSQGLQCCSHRFRKRLQGTPQ
jgi:hypothetical protein